MGDPSPGLEELAEDGDPTGLLGEVDGMNGVGSAAVVDTPDGEVDPGSLAPGQSSVFTVTADATHRFFSFARMLAPSNDTFAAFGSTGSELIDDQGTALDDQALADAVAAALSAWDAGTEANRAGAAGRDQTPRQANAGDGVGEGTGQIRGTKDDPVWMYPEPEHLLRVIVGPTR